MYTHILLLLSFSVIILQNSSNKTTEDSLLGLLDTTNEDLEVALTSEQVATEAEATEPTMHQTVKDHTYFHTENGTKWKNGFKINITYHDGSDLVRGVDGDTKSSVSAASASWILLERDMTTFAVVLYLLF